MLYVSQCARGTFDRVQVDPAHSIALCEEVLKLRAQLQELAAANGSFRERAYELVEKELRASRITDIAHCSSDLWQATDSNRADSRNYAYGPTLLAAVDALKGQI